VKQVILKTTGLFLVLLCATGNAATGDQDGSQLPRPQPVRLSTAPASTSVELPVPTLLPTNPSTPMNAAHAPARAMTSHGEGQGGASGEQEGLVRIPREEYARLGRNKESTEILYYDEAISRSIRAQETERERARQRALRDSTRVDERISSEDKEEGEGAAAAATRVGGAEQEIQRLVDSVPAAVYTPVEDITEEDKVTLVPGLEEEVRRVQEKLKAGYVATLDASFPEYNKKYEEKRVSEPNVLDSSDEEDREEIGEEGLEAKEKRQKDKRAQRASDQHARDPETYKRNALKSYEKSFEGQLRDFRKGSTDFLNGQARKTLADDKKEKNARIEELNRKAQEQYDQQVALIRSRFQGNALRASEEGASASEESTPRGSLIKGLQDLLAGVISSRFSSAEMLKGKLRAFGEQNRHILNDVDMEAFIQENFRGRRFDPAATAVRDLIARLSTENDGSAEHSEEEEGNLFG